MMSSFSFSFRMSPIVFEDILRWVASYIQKKETKMRELIFPRQRFCVASRYLVTDNAQVTIAADYRMSPASIGRRISETCKTVRYVLINKDYLDHSNFEHD